MLRPMYDWMIALSKRRSAPWVLAAVAFAESSFFPLPPDIMLMPMSLANPRLALRYALICTVASVLGGIVGYAIGHLLFETIGMRILDLYGLSAKIADVKAGYDKYGAFLIIAKGFTPIPFKLVTIVSGALEYNFALFVILSILTRGARFFVLAVLFNRFGEPMQRFVEKRLGFVTLVLLGIIVLGFYLTGKLV